MFPLFKKKYNKDSYQKNDFQLDDQAMLPFAIVRNFGRGLFLM